MDPNDAYLFDHAARQREMFRAMEEAEAEMRKRDLPPLDPSASEVRPRSTYEFIQRRNQ